MTTSNEIVIEVFEDVLFIPLESVQSEGDSITYVYIKDGASFIRQQVALGSENDNHVIVKQGLKLEDEVMLSVPAKTEGLPMKRLTP